MNTPAPAIELAGIRFAWPGADAFTLEVPRFAVCQGERVLLVGPSGSGKSTLLALIAGIAAPQAGTVEVAGARFDQMSGPARDRFRADRLGVIFQMFNLLPYLSVQDNVLLPLRLSPARKARAGDPAAEAARLLAAVDLNQPGLARQKAATLSTGQQQRVAVARALIGNPSLIIADEPTSALDRDRQANFLRLLFAEADRSGTTIVMVSHDETLAPRFSRMVRLTDIAGVRNAELV